MRVEIRDPPPLNQCIIKRNKSVLATSFGAHLDYVLLANFGVT
jgi:hypothetical protein